MKRNIHFGIKFPKGLPLDSDTKHKLAKLLFLSPTTSALEAKKIIEHKKLALAASKLIKTLDCEIVSVSFGSGEDEETGGSANRGYSFTGKLEDWQKYFSLPTEEELQEIMSEISIKIKKILQKLLKKTGNKNFNSPVEIADYLSEYIIGQDNAVKTISVLVKEHKMRLETCKDLPKTSALFIGGTGSGKTYIINKAREILNVPIIRISCGELVPSGIVGNTINRYLTKLFQSTNYNNEVTSKAIIQFDEIDKISSHYHSGQSEWKTTIQLELLKMFDLNEKIYFPAGSEQFSHNVELSTNKLMLLFSGAFSGLENIIFSRLLVENDGNLNLVDKENLLQYCSTEDIQNYGIIPELAGRLSFICPLRNLNADDIYKILTKAKDSELSKHLKKCEMEGLSLRFTDDALRIMAEKVAKNKTGVRYLGSLLNTVLRDVYFDAGYGSKKEYLIDVRTMMKVFNTGRYHLVFKAFENKVDLGQIAMQFGLSIDDVLDLYVEWKKFYK